MTQLMQFFCILSAGVELSSQNFADGVWGLETEHDCTAHWHFKFDVY